MKLNPQARDELLIRLDEKTLNIIKTIADVCSNLKELNGKVSSNEQRISALETADKIRMKLNNGAKPLLITQKQLITVFFFIGIFISGIIYGFGKFACWW